MLAGFGALEPPASLEKPVNGFGATDGATFAPAGAGTLLPPALSAVCGFGGLEGSLGGMKRVSPRGIKRRSHCSSTLLVGEEF
jgi:hypothetical protein